MEPPRSPTTAFLTQVTALRQSGRRMEAKELCDQALKADPDNIDAHRQMAQILAEIFEFELAEEHARTVLTLLDERPSGHLDFARYRAEASIDLIRILGGKGDHDAALKVCNEALADPTTHPLRDRLRIYHGLIRIALQSIPKANEEFDAVWSDIQATSTAGNLPEPADVMALGNAFLSISELRKAIEVFEFVTKHGRPGGAYSFRLTGDQCHSLISDAWTGIGACYYVLRDLAKSKDAHENAHRFNPQSPVAKINLAQLASENSDPASGRQCLDYLEEAATLIAHSRNPAFWSLWPQVINFAVHSEHGPDILDWLRRKGALNEWQHCIEKQRCDKRKSRNEEMARMADQVSRWNWSKLVAAWCFGGFLCIAGSILAWFKGPVEFGVGMLTTKHAGYALVVLGAFIGVGIPMPFLAGTKRDAS